MESTVGTPFYMAPEILLRHKYTYKVDVYSFALIAIEMITSKRSPIDIGLISGKENQEFFEKCLSPDPEERPDFSQICELLTSSTFTSIFNNLDYDEVECYLDEFETDPEALLVHGLLLANNKSEKDKETIANYYKTSADKGNSTAMFNYALMLDRKSVV